jgi:hypothetical protein
MNRFQDVDFRTVGEFLDYLPPAELKIVERLRELVFECIPDAKEKLAYNVPFYYRYARIVFIWAGSVPWGKTPKEGVELGFCRGHLLSDPSYLNAGNRKEVYIKTFYSTKDIDADAVRQLLYEAVVIDEEEHRAKRRKH